LGFDFEVQRRRLEVPGSKLYAVTVCFQRSVEFGFEN
jgi:hypothetical protein